MKLILAIDQSTQGTKALIFTPDGQPLARADRSHRQIVNDLGWVSHDLHEIWKNIKLVCADVIDKAGVSAADIAVIGLTNQRETACCWDRITGEPLCNAIVWQCSRASNIAQELSRHADTILQRTGLVLSPYFSAAKFRWMLENEPAVLRARSENRLCLGTVDAYMLSRMTHEQSFQTDCSNASRTQLMNLSTLDWDDELLDLFGIRRNELPKISMSDSRFGGTDIDGLLPSSVPICAMLGDSHAALFAHHGIHPGDTKITYGTGSSVMMNAGSVCPQPQNGISVSLAWGIENQPVYCLEANVNYTGAVTTWLIDQMQLISSPKEAGQIASAVQDNGGVYLVPAFSGLGAPHFNPDARAAIVGMTRTCGKAQIVRAAEECIAYQITDAVQAVTSASAYPLRCIHADGGPTQDRFLMQFQADMLNVPLVISNIQELSAAGAAFCAGISSGLTTAEAIFSQRKNNISEPNMSQSQRSALLQGWHNAVSLINQHHRKDEAI